ncbi:unnamed protein product [Camellia sinensis]
METFEAAIGRLHDIKQIKNKYNQLKKEWRAWSKFMDCWKGPTGIGFDQLTGLFNASSDWWAKVEKIDKECCKFITKTLEHPKLMESVFRGVVATSKYASTPGETRSELELEGQPNSPTDSRDSNEFAVYGRPRSSEMENMMNSATIKAEGSGSKQKHSSCKTMQNKHITGDTALVSSIDDLVNSVKTQSKELTINQVISMHSYTIAEAIARHYAIKGLNPTDPLLHFGFRLIDILNNWELRMSISTDQDILEWVQAKKADKASSGGPTLLSLLHNKGIRF